MRNFRTIFMFAFLLIAGWNLHAQSWPDHSGPGIPFYNSGNFAPEALEWIRTHHLKSYSRIDNWPPNPDLSLPHDTMKWEFSYSGDTLIAFNFRKGDSIDSPSETISKYDKRDTIREIDYFSGNYHSVEVFDSLGPGTTNLDSILGRTIKYYYGPSKRIDSQVYTYKNLLSPNENPSKAIRVINYFDAMNRIICSNWFYNDGKIVSDSIIRSSDGRTIRTSTHELANDSILPCLCNETEFDDHGNPTRMLAEWFIDFAPPCCLMSLDTVEFEYKYDRQGRPIEEIRKRLHTEDKARRDNSDTTFYKWREDNLPLSCSIVNNDGSIVEAEKYIYEF